MAVVLDRADVADAPRAPRIASRRERRSVGALSAVGGVLAVVGSGLPWLSFFAGLTTVAGWDGLIGQASAALGAVAILLGVVYAASGRRSVRWAIAGTGFALAALAGWATVNLLSTLRDLDQSPLLVGAAGPGLPVLAVGAALVFITFFVPATRTRRD